MPPRTPRATRPPLDADALGRLALHYAARYATTRAKLKSYLDRKLRERGFEGVAPDVGAIVARMAEAGYVDDRAFAESRSAAMGRRGYGGRRIGAALGAAGIDRETIAVLHPDAAHAFDAAERYARRKRIGPFANDTTDSDPDTRRRTLAAMLRAGHDFALARRFTEAAPGAFPKRHDDETLV